METATSSSPPTSATRADRIARVLVLATLAVVAGTLLWHTTGDLDLPLHDRLGNDLLGGNWPPRTNHLSHTAPDHHWINHEWGFQAAVALAGNLAGDGGIAAREAGWRWLRMLLGLGLIAALLVDQRWGRRAPPAALLGVGLMVLALLWTRLILRPELASALILVLVTGRIEAHLRQREPGSPWLAVLDPRRPGGQATLLALIWYQVHGFAALTLLLWPLAALLDGGAAPANQRWRRALPGLVAALVAGLATPNGVAGLLYPLQALGQFTGGDRADLRNTISELVPLLETRGALATTLLLFKISVGWAALWLVLTRHRESWFRPVVFGLALAAAFLGQRNLGLYAVALALLHGGPTPAIALPWRHRWGKNPRITRGASLVVLAAGMLLAIWWIATLASSQFYLDEGVARRTGTGLTPAVYPVAQAQQLASAPPLRLANTIDTASTLIHSRAGLVSIDGRTEAYPASAWRDYGAFRSGGASTLQQLRQWRAQAVCLAHRNSAARAIIRTLDADSNWTLVSADAAGVLFLPGQVEPEPWRLEARACRDRLQPGASITVADEAAAWANLLTLLGDGVLAEDLLSRAEQHAPKHPVILHNLGNLLMARGNLEGALTRFENAALRNRAAAPPLVNAGNCLFNLGRAREARERFESAVGRDPGNFEAWANLAEVRRHLGDRDGAGAAYRRALEIRPDEHRLRQRARSL